MTLRLPRSTLFPYTTLFRSVPVDPLDRVRRIALRHEHHQRPRGDRHERQRASHEPPHHRDAEHREALMVLVARSEEHTSELQSLTNLVCRLLLEKKTSGAID